MEMGLPKGSDESMFFFFQGSKMAGIHLPEVLQGPKTQWLSFNRDDVEVKAFFFGWDDDWIKLSYGFHVIYYICVFKVEAKLGK